MELKEVADRLEIQELLAAYCHALDRQDWTEFRRLFTSDAQLDFTAFGGPTGGVEDLIGFLQPVLSELAASHHMTSTSVIAPEGDRARVRSAGHVTMVARTPDGGEHPASFGLWYDDVLARTADGWRIASRRQERAWTGGYSSQRA